MEKIEVSLSDRDRMIFEDIAHTLRAIEKNLPRQTSNPMHLWSYPVNQQTGEPIK
jgi:hypothetical protein